MADQGRVKEIFVEALDFPESQRAGYLEKACGGDASLRSEVEALLRALDDRPVLDAATISPDSTASVPDAPGEGPGTQIHQYKLLEQIGEGGFGSVFVAEQDRPVRRRVALKIIKLGMDTRQVIARFEAERQALAMMEHPHIARVLDAGATETGRPYFVMELVRGEPITTYCDQNKLTVPERLALFAQVCHAVQHAHQKGIIHRDIKPSNVLVCTQDGRPHAKVIDFGIAKATAARLTEKTLFTEYRSFIGTPPYMSPEQAGGGLDIDTRTDVYSLGVLLYELLTGSTPFDPEALRSAAYGEIQRIIREVEPPRPSTRIAEGQKTQTQGADGADGLVSSKRTTAAIAAQRRIEPRKLFTLLRGELDCVVMKALDKDRSRRYESANELAMDVQRYLAGEAVVAVPPSAAYRLRKFIRVHRVGAAALGSVALALMVGLGAATYGFLSASHERDSKAAALKKAERIAGFLSETFKGVRASVAGGRDTAMLREMMDTAAKRIAGGELKGSPEAELRLRLTIADTYREISRFEDAERMLEDTEDLARRTSGDRSEAMAEVLTCRAVLRNAQGRAAEGLSTAQAALEILGERVHGDDGRVLSCLNDIGHSLDVLSRPAEALEKYEAALAMARRLHPGEHADVALSLQNVATALLSLGRSSEALPKFESAFQMVRRINQGDHPDTAVCLNNLAACLKSLSRYEEALAKYEESLAMRQRLYQTSDHMDAAEALNNIAATLERLGRPAEALSRYQAALEMAKRIQKGDHEAVALCLNNVGQCLGALGRVEEALHFEEDALAMWQRLFPGDHAMVAAGLNNLAGCLGALGRHAEALPKKELALAMYKRLHPGDHPDIAWSLQQVAESLEALKRHGEALPRLEASKEMYRRLYTEDHEDVALALNNLAGCLQAMSRFEEALSSFEEAVAMWRRIYKGEHPYLEAGLFNVGDCLYSLGRSSEAVTRYEEALAMRRTLLPPGDQRLAAQIAKLAQIDLKLGRPGAAEPLLRECLSIREQAYPDEHPQAWLRYNTMSMLGEALLGLGRFAEAEPLLVDSYAFLKKDPRVPPPAKTGGFDRKREALERLVKLYTAWNAAEKDKGHDARARAWETELAGMAK